jgi:5-methylcytosine-specific restriction protein A
LVRDGSGRCVKHPRDAWIKTTPVKRITGRRLQAMRARLFAHSPLCVECLRQGLAIAATQRDHIIPLGEGGVDDETNEQALCDACHETKSLAEAQRGRRRRA